MIRARRARVTFAAISSRSTAAVDSRSSQNAMGSSVSRAKLRAKARVACARGPSLPFMLIGSPRTKATACRSAASASSRAASAENVLRAMVSTPAASRRSGSLAAAPVFHVPALDLARLRRHHLDLGAGLPELGERNLQFRLFESVHGENCHALAGQFH